MTMVRRISALFLLVPSLAAAEQFTCALKEGCGTAECGGDATISAQLIPAPTGWALTSNSEIAGHFTELSDVRGARHFVSTDIDPEAGAAALLTVFENGEAMLSLHGVFLTPQAGTYTGTCTLETS